jgi:spermidine/putrescine transport system substrate-binding protein
MKRFLGLLLACVLVLPLALSSGCAAANQKVLYVYNWGDYIQQDDNGRSQVLDEFQKQTGIKVVYSTYDSNESLYDKVKADSSQYDVIVPSDYMVERMAKAGMLEEIDKSKIPNYSNIDADFKNMAFDPDGKYSVPYMWGTLGFVYDKATITKPVDSWSILWDKDYTKKKMMYDSSRDTISVGLYYKGFKVNSVNQGEIDQATQALIDQKPLVLSYAEDNIRDMMISGEAAMALVYSGDAVRIMSDPGKGSQFGYCIPKEGSNIWMDNLCIVKGSKHIAEAEAFINFLCQPDICERNAEAIGYTPPEKAAYNMLPDNLKNISAMYPTEEEIARLTAYRDLGDFNEKYEDAWTRIKAS